MVEYYIKFFYPIPKKPVTGCTHGAWLFKELKIPLHCMPDFAFQTIMETIIEPEYGDNIRLLEFRKI